MNKHIIWKKNLLLLLYFRFIRSKESETFRWCVKSLLINWIFFQFSRSVIFQADWAGLVWFGRFHRNVAKKHNYFDRLHRIMMKSKKTENAIFKRIFSNISYFSMFGNPLSWETKKWAILAELSENIKFRAFKFQAACLIHIDHLKSI